MKTSISTLKSYFESGDKPSQKDFENLIDSFLHKDEGVAIKSVNINGEGDYVFTFSDNTSETIKQLPREIPISSIANLQNQLDRKVNFEASKELSSQNFTTELKFKLEQLENYVHPEKHTIVEIEDLQESLDAKVGTTGDEVINGAKVFNEIVELINGLKISSFSGTGLRNLVVQADGTVAVRAIATDLFIDKTTFDEASKTLTLSLINGTTIDVDLSSLEDDLTGLQSSITSLQSGIGLLQSDIVSLQTNVTLLQSSTTSLENIKLDKGAYQGTAQDLDNVKRDKSAFAKSIIDVSGNLELQGDQETPGPNHYYGTNGQGVKGYYEIEPIYFNVTNLALGGSSNNTADQEFFIDLSSYSVLKPGHQLELNNIEFRGDFGLNSEYVDVAFDEAKNPKIRIGELDGRDSSQWQKGESIGDGSVVTIVQLATEEVGFVIYVSPSAAVNFRPRGMRNWWELRADVQFKI